MSRQLQAGRQQSFTKTLTRMGHDIKRIADDEWESGNPIDFRGIQAKNNYAQRAYADFNDDNYLALGLNAMKETGDKSGQYALYNAKTDGRKALDIAHLNLDDYYGSHITGAGLGNKGTAYSYDASALKVLPKDIGKLSTNEQMDTPAQKANSIRASRKAMGLPDVIPTLTKPTVEPHEVEQEEDAPPDEDAGKPDAPPPKSEADVMAERMAEASKNASKAGEASVGGTSSVAGGDAGGTVRFTKEGETKNDPFFTSRAKRDVKLETASGRTIETLATVKKGTPASEKARALELASPTEKKKDEEGEGSEGEGSEGEGSEGSERDEEPPEELQARMDGKESVATSRAGGGAKGGFKTGHRFETRKAELEKAFPGIQNLRKTKHGEASYSTLSTGQKRFMVSIAQGKPGKPTEDLLENYSIEQGAEAEKQHDYMMKMIDAHDKTMGKKGLTGWATNLRQVADEIPSISLAKLFSLSPEGRDIIYQSTRATGIAWVSSKVRTLTDHDLHTLLALYGRVKASPGTSTRGEKSVASVVGKTVKPTDSAVKEGLDKLIKKGYDKK